MEMKLSVIIPVYKVEHLIERCVRSLMEQTLKEGIEFLFINDATPDQSMDVLNRVIADYPGRKEQVRILHNPQNLGISETRKKGIREAKGEYIGWCDSDDWCELNMFETLLAATQNGLQDIVICNVYTHELKNNEESIQICKRKPSSSTKTALKDYWIKSSVPRTLWDHISKKEIILQAAEEIFKVSNAEDSYMMLYCFYYAKTACWIDIPLYHYDRMSNNDSLTKVKYQTRDEWERQCKNIDKICLLLSTEKEYYHTVNYIKFFLKRVFRASFQNCWEFWKTYKECYKDICILDNTPSSVKWKVYLTYNFYPLFWLKFRNSFKD